MVAEVLRHAGAEARAGRKARPVRERRVCYARRMKTSAPRRYRKGESREVSVHSGSAARRAAARERTDVAGVGTTGRAWFKRSPR